MNHRQDGLDLGVTSPHRWAGDRHVAYFARMAGPMDKAVSRCKSRVGVAMVFLVVGLLFVSYRLVDIALMRAGQSGRVFQVSKHASPALGRADVVDRNGTLLATNLVTSSVFANPRMIGEPTQLARKLVAIFPDLSMTKLEKQLKSDRTFVWVKRNITPQQQYEVNKLGVPGLNFQKEEQRVYPQGQLLGHVLGYVDVDNHGIAGIEKSLNSTLVDPAHYAEPITLSIDTRVQHTMHTVLQEGIKEFQAKGAVGIVLNVRTGEVISMVSLPDFDPHQPNSPGAADARFNRASLGVYEMGSTFKGFTIAMALDSGRVKMSDQFDATQPISFGRFKINDSHPEHRWLTLPEVFMLSSNIGTVKIVEKMGPKKQQEYFRQLGFFEPVNIELPERGAPMFPSQWQELTMMTTSFGHGIAVSPLHVVRATAALVNGGRLPELTLLKTSADAMPKGKQVVKSETSQAMRMLMRQVVVEGTGKSSEVKGYFIGGKTGTAEKTTSGGYDKKALLTSFVASFPMQNPQYVTLVMFDEPQPTKKTYGFATAGWNAAPMTALLVERIAPLLGVMPLPVDETEIIAKRKH